MTRSPFKKAERMARRYVERDMAWGSPEGCVVTTGAVPGPRPKATVPTAHVRKSQDPGLRGERPLGGLSFSVLELSKRIRDDDDDDGNGFLEKIEETIEEESRKGKSFPGVCKKPEPLPRRRCEGGRGGEQKGENSACSGPGARLVRSLAATSARRRPPNALPLPLPSPPRSRAAAVGLCE